MEFQIAEMLQNERYKWHAANYATVFRKSLSYFGISSLIERESDRVCIQKTHTKLSCH